MVFQRSAFKEKRNMIATTRIVRRAGKATRLVSVSHSSLEKEEVGGAYHEAKDIVRRKLTRNLLYSILVCDVLVAVIEKEVMIACTIYRLVSTVNEKKSRPLQKMEKEKERTDRWCGRSEDGRE
jgi:hypothetical protein